MINRNTSAIHLSSVASVMGIVTAILMLVNIVMSTRVAQDGLAIDTLSKRQQTLLTTIHDLEQKLYTETSLNDLSQKADELGYVSASEIKNISSQARIAYNR